MTYCLLPEAQYGQYSSFDGGRSALKLLEKCGSEVAAFLEECEKTNGQPDADKTCLTTAAIAAQVAIKSFGK